MDMVEKLKALGEPNRYRVAMMLLLRPLCVCEILEVLQIAGPTLSSHLKILKTASLVDSRKDGKWVEYFLPEENRDFLLDLHRRSAESQVKKDWDILQTLTREICTIKKGP
jgi:ArsR family transcriptional regulator